MINQKIKNTKSRSENVERRLLVYDNVLYIHDELLNDYEVQYTKSLDEKKKKSVINKIKKFIS